MDHVRSWTGRFRKALIIENPSEILDEELVRQGFEVERLKNAPSEDELARILATGGHHLLYKRSAVEVTERGHQPEPGQGIGRVNFDFDGGEAWDHRRKLGPRSAPARSSAKVILDGCVSHFADGSVRQAVSPSAGELNTRLASATPASIVSVESALPLTPAAVEMRSRCA